MKLRTLYTTAALLIVSSVASADPITITNPFGTTLPFNSLGATDLPVTSVYVNDGTIVPGNEATGLVGTTLAFTDNGLGTIGQFSPLLGTVPTAGYGDDWVLDFSYSLSGVANFVDGAANALLADGTLDANGDGVIDQFDAIIPTYSGGIFEFFYRNVHTSASTKVLEMDLSGFQVSGPSVIFDATVDYSWYAGGSSLVDNFFTDDSGYTFYELAQSGGAVAQAEEISFRADFNVDPNLLPTCENTACDNLTRNTDLNLSAVFAVPEPTSIAILGLGLLGLGLRRKTKA